MVDEFDQIETRGKKRWMAAIFVNLLIWGLLTFVGYMWFTRKPIVEIKSIVASRLYPVNARQNGRIGKIYFEKTQPFKKGDLLFNVETPELLTQLEKTSETIARIEHDIEVEQSELGRRLRQHDLTVNIETIKQSIQETSLTIKILQIEQQQAETDFQRLDDAYRRAQQLFTSGVLTRRELEDRYSILDAAQKTVDIIRNNIELKREQIRGYSRKLALSEQYREDMIATTASAIKDLEKEKEAELKTLAELLVQKSKLAYYAEFDGFVAGRHAENGTVVSFGDPVLKITTGEELWVEAYFPPAEEHLVQPGDKVTVRYGLQTFEAVVETKSLDVEPFPNSPVGPLSPLANYVVIKLNFVNLNRVKEAGLRPGIPVITEAIREAGLLYRLGIKKSRPAPSASKDS